VITSIIILEPWKGLGYTRRNTRFTVDPRGEPEARVIHLVVVEDPIFEPWEKGKYQSEVLEDEYFPDECGDHLDILQPIPQGRKHYQSLFSLDFEDMASPYGGGGDERGVRRFSSAVGNIEVDDFKREFTMWYELQKSRCRVESLCLKKTLGS
jgi:hypothetical protein